MVYAGFWRRAAALILDSLLWYGAFLGILYSIYLLYKMSGASLFSVSGFGGAKLSSSLETLWGSIALQFFWEVLYWLTAAVFESSRFQATPGKMAFRIMVCDVKGCRLSYRRALVRQACQLLSALSLGAGYIMAGSTRHKQALHDIIAECYVIRKGS